MKIFLLNYLENSEEKNSNDDIKLNLRKQNTYVELYYLISISGIQYKYKFLKNIFF